jgi:hypothetical protein
MQFWSNDPSILINKDYILDLWPTESMCYEQKMNAISRLIIVLSVVGFIVTMSLRTLFIGAVTLGILYFMWTKKMGEKGDVFTASKTDRSGSLEGFKTNYAGVDDPVPANGDVNPTVTDDATPQTTVSPITLESVLKEKYYPTTKKNPLSNVLLTEIMDDPLRKPAPPSFNVDVSDDITTATKKTVQYLNPGIRNTNKQLFGTLTDHFYLDQSNRSFFSTANTKIPNDQGAFADYLYGDMPSCRDGDGIQCIKDNYRYNLY